MILQDRLFALCAALAVVAVLLLGGGAFAADEVVNDNWKQLDANSDGKVTPVENRANADAAFKKVDSNGDGSVSQAEYFAAMQAVLR